MRQGAAGREYWDYRSSLWLRPKDAEFGAMVSSVVILHRLKRGWNLSDACTVVRSARRGDPPPSVESEWRDLLSEQEAHKARRHTPSPRAIIREAV